MTGRFRIDKLRGEPLTLRVHWGANVLIGACFVVMSTFTAARAVAQTSPSSPQAQANEANAGKKGDSEACVAKPDASAGQIPGPAARDAREYPETISEENGDAASATNLTLQAPSTTDSAKKDVQSGEPASDVPQESQSEESTRRNPGSPQQCTLSKGPRETDHVPLR